jgi:hypothetical protein
MNKQQTAVQWLFNKIYGETGHIGSYTVNGEDAFVAYQTALNMERSQISDAFKDAWYMAKNSAYADPQSNDYFVQTYKIES